MMRLYLKGTLGETIVMMPIVVEQKGQAIEKFKSRIVEEIAKSKVPDENLMNIEIVGD